MAQPPQRPDADHNLLFGILALQVNFISRDALVAAMSAWVLAKHRPLGHILLDQGQLTHGQVEALDALIAQHLLVHADDPQRSLQALPAAAAVRPLLTPIADDDLQASLTSASSDTGEEPTREHRPPPRDGAGRYRILRPHARGGLGEVYVAEDTELHREVALKQIQAQRAHDPDSRSRFVLEAEITGGLEHPGVVPVYGLGAYADGRPFYAMRFIKGDSLKDAVERFHAAEKPGRDPGERSLALRQLLRRFVDVCNAVAYAHSRGVVHRDLKPANIMLGKFGETLVVDWGLAKAGVGKDSAVTSTAETVEPTLRPSSGSDVAATRMGSALGTPGFMSPEQMAGRLDLVGPASDVYSLGATLYALLTGRRPFQGVEKDGLTEAVRQGRFPRRAR